MTESQVVNEWIQQGIVQGELKTQRQSILELLEFRFPGLVPADVVQLILQQDSIKLLDDWFGAGLRALTFDQFLAVLKR